MLCPNCNSANTYFDGIDNRCIDCRTKWLRDGAQEKTAQNIPRIISHETTTKTEGKEMPKTEPCRNCGRNKPVISDGLCGGCNSAVYRKFTKGTPEYDNTLAEAKKRFTDPDAKPLPRGIKKSKTASAKPMAAPEKQKKITPQIKSKNKKQEVGILVVLEDRRHELMEEVTEINKTIEVIKRYA